MNTTKDRNLYPEKKTKYANQIKEAQNFIETCESKRQLDDEKLQTIHSLFYEDITKKKKIAIKEIEKMEKKESTLQLQSEISLALLDNKSKKRKSAENTKKPRNSKKAKKEQKEEQEFNAGEEPKEPVAKKKKQRTKASKETLQKQLLRERKEFLENFYQLKQNVNEFYNYTEEILNKLWFQQQWKQYCDDLEQLNLHYEKTAKLREDDLKRYQKEIEKEKKVHSALKNKVFEEKKKLKSLILQKELAFNSDMDLDNVVQNSVSQVTINEENTFHHDNNDKYFDEINVELHSGKKKRNNTKKFDSVNEKLLEGLRSTEKKTTEMRALLANAYSEEPISLAARLKGYKGRMTKRKNIKTHNQSWKKIK